jgi:DNA-binding NarL/FixJ family response regulator
MSIRVAIVEDEASVRESLARFVDAASGFCCVAKCANAGEAARMLPKEFPDVALMDINLPGKSGIECVRELKALLPSTQFLMLTIEEDSQRVFESLQAGATGYLVKNLPPEKILDAVAEVNRGGSPISSHIARLIVRSFHQSTPKHPPETHLTMRESEILSLLARGYRSKEIADELGISVPTVNTHVRNVYEKLHVRSRAEAVARFLGKAG